jgi:uncharacterized protein
MDGIALAFVTGLTTGGLSCLAVQGGLLAASIAHQIEADIAQQNVDVPVSSVKRKARRATAPGKAMATRATPEKDHSLRVALPIILFLMAKVTAYTLLGFALGALGSVLELTPSTRAVLMLGIGIFLIGNALRMLNVHPIFRYFNIEPPKAVTRYIRRRAKGNADLATPLFLGFLTVLIPCGVTQAMMLVALGTGSAVQGAAIMFAFTLGTTPVFFALAYLATRLGKRLERQFTLVAAAVLIVIGVVSVTSASALLGFPISLPFQQSAVAANLPAPLPTATAGSAVAAPATGSGAAAAPSAAEQTLTIKAQNAGYFPALLQAKAGAPVKLQLVTNKTTSCARAFIIPKLKMQRVLPETGTVVFDIPPQPAGTTINYTCSMGMYTGKIQFN